ncbi:hypothetical protein ACLHLP_03950 [Weissella confusa]|uniref:hypothetical protein n=1 Tax=Weissella confusa TaxID=1583 RepID=UPI003982F0D8
MGFSLNEWKKKHSKELSDIAAILIALGIMVLIINPSLSNYLLAIIYHVPTIIDYFFSTGGNVHHFQWVGVSTIIAAVGFVYNQSWERKKFNANLISKTRLEWTNVVRNLLGEYLSVASASVNKLANYYVWAFMKDAEVDNTDAAFQRREELNELIARANTLFLTMTVYIPNHAGDDNQSINQALDNTEEQVESSQKAIEAAGRKQMLDLKLGRISILEARQNFDKVVAVEKALVNNRITELDIVAQQYFSDIWRMSKEGK